MIVLDAMNRMFRVSDELFFCEAGVENTDAALVLQQAGRSGGEWLYRLPGTIGATVRMNGRCYGREISAVTRGVVTVGLGGAVRWRQAREVFLGYKETRLMRSPEIVVGAMLEFAEEDAPEAVGARMREYGDDRDAKHQFDFPSCGSTFKNSYEAGRPSGQIFDALGFRGRRQGGAQVSDHHANFIFNTGGAKAADILKLCAAMRTEAREKAGAALELELQCAGLFETALLDACGIASTPEPSRTGYSWAGLLRFPEALDAAFPRTLLQGPALDYFCRDVAFPAGIAVEVEQLASLDEARKSPEQPFIRWTTRNESANAFSLRSSEPAGSFVDHLWESSVSELFVGHGGGSGQYLEFEVTSEGHWLAIRFDVPRQRATGHETPSEVYWHGKAKSFTSEAGFGMELSYALLERFIHDGRLMLQCAVSLGNGRYGLFPWWDAEGAPDFHQPARFCVVRVG
ncbi:UDP-N-acetylenolpyruvoylglucosamine reductase [Chlorobaculum sp. MV4-Y]|uniref:UDP-N-acetylenolpyruvoylglucosamine reductase n=1 Tax=Chlorobaculum sp. MV4-Y TaxID=2976335 RepID=UPI0021AEB94A|nr:UDP-N-acetylenolpyruvoylglucosamine reductase [Chlorobaculum sp. MV4-Y]UWX58662.1 UDP-N-acetylenolpyruvoylglucosamine reductase [Chlorobaculum sp. MV4-Y]